jgi:2-polyprenyl-3-methyl-5-hydroxy-6-metoxy-1,4-benzoquinol methylase
MNTNFDHYTAVDISPTCVEMSKDFVNYTIGNLNKNCDIINKDFFDYKTDKPFDAVVAGEILEHVENPLPFLDKIYQVADDNARVFITTAINAPQPDHIYLFNNLNEVTDLLKTAGFSVVDYVATNTNNVPIEKAEKRKIPIVVGFILKKII